VAIAYQLQTGVGGVTAGEKPGEFRDGGPERWDGRCGKQHFIVGVRAAMPAFIGHGLSRGNGRTGCFGCIGAARQETG
jgi:hypothetical protein